MLAGQVAYLARPWLSRVASRSLATAIRVEMAKSSGAVAISRDRVGMDMVQVVRDLVLAREAAHGHLDGHALAIGVGGDLDIAVDGVLRGGGKGGEVLGADGVVGDDWSIGAGSRDQSSGRSGGEDGGCRNHYVC